MKLKSVALAFVFAFIASTGYAQTIEQTLTGVFAKTPSVQERIYAVHDLLQVASDTRTALRAEGAIGKAKLDDITAQSARYSAVVDDHNTRTANYNARTANQNDRAARHNANVCTYYEGHEQDCAGYNQESAAINSEKNSLDSEKDVLGREKENLDAAGGGLQLIIDDYNKWKDDFNGRNTINEHNIDVLMRVLAILQKSNQDCTAVLQDKSATPEHVSEVCGQGFDGNGVHGTLTPGGQTPNMK